MNAITILATIVTVTVVVVPALAELGRILTEQRNPLRHLRVPTRRNQVRELSASSSFA
jgi:hypothetical protein